MTPQLKDLCDDELVKIMHSAIYDGEAEIVDEGTSLLLERGWTAGDVLDRGLIEGLQPVSVEFRAGSLFVPEVLLAAEAMKAGMMILRPLLAKSGERRIGKVVIGTVKGDIHDIGKNLVSMMLEGNGFEVLDIGIDVGVDKYLQAVEEHKPDILGLSALLTTTMPYMRTVIEALEAKGIRNSCSVLVGGAPLNEAFAKNIGADGYCPDAAVAVEMAKSLVARRQALAV